MLRNYPLSNFQASLLRCDLFLKLPPAEISLYSHRAPAICPELWNSDPTVYYQALSKTQTRTSSKIAPLGHTHLGTDRHNTFSPKANRMSPQRCCLWP